MGRAAVTIIITELHLAVAKDAGLPSASGARLETFSRNTASARPMSSMVRLRHRIR